MAGFTAVAAGISLATTAGTTAGSFIQAGKQRQARDKAEREALKKMNEAREKISINYMESLSLPLDAFEAETERIISQTAQATEAARQGDQRGVAATAGLVQQAGMQAQEQKRIALSEQLFNLEKLKRGEDKRIAGALGALDLQEAKNAQDIAADADKASAAARAQGVQGVMNLSTQALDFVPLYKRQGAKARQAALTSTQYDDDTFQKIGNVEGLGEAGEGFTNLDLDAIGKMSRQDYRKFERSLDRNQRSLLFNADYYENLMPGGIGGFYNIGTGTRI